MKIDFVSDVVCPWCAIGLASLEQALQRVAPGIEPSIHFQPFELNPDMPPEGEDIVLHLTRKYGSTPEQVAANAEAIRQRGAALGFRFGIGKRSRTYNTFDAHRLLHWAGLQGEAAQRALKHGLLAAYFTDGENPSDRALLARVAGEAGLDATEAAAVLADGRYADEVREAQALYRQHGISSVPSIIIDDQYLISGGQPPEVFEQALRQIAARQA